jgi:hypothetical protein
MRKFVCAAGIVTLACGLNALGAIAANAQSGSMPGISIDPYEAAAEYYIPPVAKQLTAALAQDAKYCDYAKWQHDHDEFYKLVEATLRYKGAFSRKLAADYNRIPPFPKERCKIWEQIPAAVGLRASMIDWVLEMGLLSTTATYDDGFKVPGTTGVLGANVGIRQPLGSDFFGGLRVGFGLPFSGSEKQFATTRLNWFTTAEAEAGTKLAVFPAPVTVFGSFGGIVADTTVGSTFPGSSWTDSQISGGLTASGGFEIPATGNWSIVGRARYFYLPFANFNSPTGSFILKQEGFIGSVGGKFTFN